MYYQIDLPRDLGTKRLTFRRLGVLIKNLPEGAATLRSVHGLQDPWGLTEHLLALIADALHAANWQRARNKKLPRPKPIQRPGVAGAGPSRTSLTSAQIADRLRRLQHRDQRRRSRR